jgi:hypothetical protein
VGELKLLSLLVCVCFFDFVLASHALFCLCAFSHLPFTLAQAARGHGEVVVREVGNGQRARHAIAQISQEMRADILVLGIFGRKHEGGAHKVIYMAFSRSCCDFVW